MLIVSGGFKEFITPVVTEYFIRKENIYANTFVFDENDNIVGYDRENPLSQEGGKVKLLRQMNLQGEIFGIGDGYSDFQLKESGLIKKFFAFPDFCRRQGNNLTPTVFKFTGLEVASNYVKSASTTVQLTASGAPYYVAVLVVNSAVVRL